MKRMYLSVIVLIGLVLLTTAVYAEGATDTNSKTVNQSEPLYLRYYFSAVEAQAMIASETAFDYILTNNSATKDEYYKEMNATDAAIAAFENARKSAIAEANAHNAKIAAIKKKREPLSLKMRFLTNGLFSYFPGSYLRSSIVIAGLC